MLGAEVAEDPLPPWYLRAGKHFLWERLTTSWSQRPGLQIWILASTDFALAFFGGSP